LRGWFFLSWDESYFDSDQAIIGLMAKHLSEGRAFPLFFYGQEYMLGVEAWLMAPVFAAIGPTVFALRLTMVLVNVAVALVLWHLLRRDGRLGPWTAALAASPFVLAPFVTAAHLVEAQGGNPEPFLWILVLWLLRARPLALGAAMAAGFLHREFTAYAWPAIFVIDLAERWRAEGVAREERWPSMSEALRRSGGVLRPWMLTAFAFLVVFAGINGLKPFADLMGPGSAGVAIDVAPQDNVTLLLGRAEVDARAIPAHLREIVVEHVPMILGLRGFRPYLLSIGSDAHVGWDELLPLCVPAAVLLVGWLVVDVVRRRRTDGLAFPAFLALVGLQSLVVYAVTRDPSIYTLRYGLLALVLPIGIAALWLQPWRPARLRAVAAVLLGLLAAAATVDHVVVLERAMVAPPPVRFSGLAARLVERGDRVARGTYWRAYAVTFMSGERVHVASTDLYRIREYQLLAEKAGPTALISETPCSPHEKAEQIGRWFLCGG
jgi:hypothetical protein